MTLHKLLQCNASDVTSIKNVSKPVDFGVSSGRAAHHTENTQQLALNLNDNKDPGDIQVKVNVELDSLDTKLAS